MDQEHLRALLAQLHGELARGGTLDDRSRQLLVDVQADIQRAVESPAAATAGGAPTPLPASEQQSRQSRFQAAMVALEGSHPQLASALEQGMVALSNLGL